MAHRQVWPIILWTLYLWNNSTFASYEWANMYAILPFRNWDFIKLQISRIDSGVICLRLLPPNDAIFRNVQVLWRRCDWNSPHGWHSERFVESIHRPKKIRKLLHSILKANSFTVIISLKREKIYLKTFFTHCRSDPVILQYWLDARPKLVSLARLARLDKNPFINTMFFR